MMAVGEMYAYATQESSGDIRIQGPMYFREEVWWLRTNLEEAAQTHTTLRKTSNSCPYQSSIQCATTISPHPRDGHKKGEKGATDSLDSSICLCLGYQIQPSEPCSFELYQRTSLTDWPVGAITSGLPPRPFHPRIPPRFQCAWKWCASSTRLCPLLPNAGSCR